MIAARSRPPATSSSGTPRKSELMPSAKVNWAPLYHQRIGSGRSLPIVHGTGGHDDLPDAPAGFVSVDVSEVMGHDQQPAVTDA
jgi:hypothetical protein